MPATETASGTRRSTRVAPIAAFWTTATLLVLIQVLVRRPVILAERFWVGGGFVEAALLSAYAGLVAHAMADERRTARWRRRVWTFFSVAFFAQLALGLAGLGEFLMTGVLHLPVPAMIVAGPLYRGGGLFMPILFVATTLLAGPAWCSHLCYFGVWDLRAARATRRPRPLPSWRRAAQVGMLAAVAGVALALGLAGVSPSVATGLGLAFGLAGVVVMLVWSRRSGQMTHCLTWCPIGLLATSLGRLSPWRMRIAPGCDDCGACTPACRYDALWPEHVRARRPGPSCTLCGDCVRVCKRRFIEYRVFRLSPRTSRLAFLVVVVSLHAVFLGVARI